MQPLTCISFWCICTFEIFFVQYLDVSSVFAPGIFKVLFCSRAKMTLALHLKFLFFLYQGYIFKALPALWKFLFFSYQGFSKQIFEISIICTFKFFCSRTSNFRRNFQSFICSRCTDSKFICYLHIEFSNKYYYHTRYRKAIFEVSFLLSRI